MDKFRMLVRDFELAVLRQGDVNGTRKALLEEAERLVKIEEVKNYYKTLYSVGKEGDQGG